MPVDEGRASTRTAPRKVFRLVEALEDLDDVQNVFGNFDVSDEVMRVARRLTRASVRRRRCGAAATLSSNTCSSPDRCSDERRIPCACWGSTPG